jgi:hypothetical protein
VLLAAANTRPTAKTVCYGFSVVYLIVFLWGLIDGNNVFGVFPINPPDNVLHLVLALAAALCAYVSPTTKGQQRRRRQAKQARRHPEAVVNDGSSQPAAQSSSPAPLPPRDAA